jgi:hypothetical protein
VGEAERGRLVAQLQASLRTAEDRALALRAIEAVMKADGEIPEAEQAAVEEIKAAIQGSNSGGMGGLGRLMGRSVKRRSQVVENAPNRELYIDDFVKNKIYYSVSRRMELDGSHMDAPDEVLRKLSLAGGLMAVAFVDGDVTQARRMRCWLLCAGTEVTEVEAALVVEVAVSEIQAN